MGWPSIREDIELSKLRYWEHLHSLPNSRWPKQALNMIVSGSYRSHWYQDLLIIRRKSISQLPFQSDTPPYSEAYHTTNLQSWLTEKLSHSSLSYYPKMSPYFKTEHLSGSHESLVFTEYRLENWSDFNNKLCSACGVFSDCLKIHILFQCKALPIFCDLRTIWEYALNGLSLYHNLQRILLEMLDDPQFMKPIAANNG